MKPHITVITLAVDNLKRSLQFYRDGLGLATEGIIGQEFEYGAVVFFDPQAGYFQDPDCHLWEVVWNPHLSLQD